MFAQTEADDLDAVFDQVGSLLDNLAQTDDWYNIVDAGLNAASNSGFAQTSTDKEFNYDAWANCPPMMMC